MDDKFQDVRYLGTSDKGGNAQQPSASVGFGQVIPAAVPTPATPQPTPAAPAEPIRASNIDTLMSPALNRMQSSQPGFTQTPVTPPASQPSAPRGPRLHINWKKTLTFGGLAVLALLIIAGLIAVFNTVVSKKAANQQVSSKFNTVALPLGDLAAQSQDGLSILGTRSLVINGPLRANDSFIISPSAQPSNATRGQVYYDQNQNTLAYYNGNRFVPVASSDTVVQSIAGSRGNITLGQGLSSNGGQINNSGVLSLQGQTGNVTLVAGPGVTVDGTTITNTGVTSFGGSTGDITIGNGLTLTDGKLTNSGIISATGGTGISVVDDGSGNITISNTGAGTGTVQSPGGTPGRIAKFTGVQSIADSLLSESGTTVTVNGDLSVTGGLTLASALSVGNGGTGTTALTANGVVVGQGSGALTAVTAGGPGLCLLSTAGAPAFQACPGGASVTSVNGLTGALNVANATGSGTTITINDASTTQKGIAQFNNQNFTAASGIINTAQDIHIAAAPTFGRLTLTSSQATSPMLLVNNTNGAGTGNLLDLQVGGSSRLAVSPAGAMTLSGTINGQTISSSASFTGTLAVTGAASLNGGATVAGTLTANTITPTGALTVGASGQSLTLQGNGSTTLSATNGASTSTLSFQTPTANVNYRLLTAAAGTYDICTTAGNCVGVGGSVNTAGGTANQLAKFTGTNTIGSSIISDNGSTVSIAGALAVNTITPSGALTIGAIAQNLTLQGAATNITATNAGVTNTLTFATPSGGNKTITVPNATGTVVVSASGPLAIDANGNITCPTCAVSGSGVTSLNGLTGALSIANASGAGSTITIQDASTTQKGLAQFNSTNFSASAGVVNTVQNINVAATPTFGALTLTSSQATSPMLLVNNTNAGASGNLIDLQLNGTSKLAVNPSGALTLAGTVNGQTISSSANFTGTLAIAGAASLNGGATVSGTLTANTITPTGALTVGATTQSMTLQGNASSTFTATSGASTTTFAFQTPTANVTYRLLTAAAGTYDICTTVGNCAGVGGGVTTAGGTTGKVAKFTGSGSIGDSIITDNGTSVTIGGTLAVNTITPTGALTIGATSQNLALQGATTTLSATATGITNTLAFATPSGSNKTITLPNASGTVAVSASGPIVLDSAGNISCPTCALSGSGVTSLNGLSGALSIAGATGSGSTITIQDASTTQKGLAQFNSTNFTASSGTINTVQNINIAATPTFGALTLTSSQATSPMLLVNNTNGAASGNLIDLQLSGASKFAVTPAGALTLAGTVNGQTISSAASFTGTLAVAGAASLNGGATVSGTLTANTITPTGALTVGATTQAVTLQGNASSTFTATSGASTTTLAFQTPTANVTYRLLTAAAGTYDICTSVGNCAGAGGGVTTVGGTTNKLAKFTGSQTIGDSILTDNGSTVTIAGTLAVNTITPTGALTIGATSQNLALQGATTTLSATAAGVTNTLAFATPSGAGKTITLPNASGTVAVSASGPITLDANGNITCPTCALSGSGVTSLNGLTGALSIANATGSGSTVTIQDASTSQKGIAQFNSTNFSASAGVINTIQDISVAAAPTFGRLTVTSSQASNGMLLVNNTNAGATGNLLDLQLNGVSKLAVSPAGAMTLSGTVNGQTISSAASFTGTLAVTGAASLNGGATVTGTLTANTITPTGSLTIGATNKDFLLQGNSSSTITATSGANTTTFAFQTPTANVTYRLLAAAAGTYDICTTAGNCTGVGGGVTTAGGTTNTLAKFTGSGSIGDSIITDNGTTVTIGGTLAVNTITPGAAMTIGATTQSLTLQGSTTSLRAVAGTGITNTLTFATPTTTNKTITLPDATGTVAVSASGPLAIDANGNISCPSCVTTSGGGGASAVDSVDGLTGALTIANTTGSGSTITINNASTTQKGIAQFNSTNFTASSGTINTIQDINTSATPTFGRLTVTSSQASNPMLLVNNTNSAGTGNLIDLQVSGVSKLAVSPAGAMTLVGTLNGQTISSAASFTGTLAVAGAASLNGGATVTGTLTANTITPTSALTVGATSQSFLVQGSSASTITATSGANTTTVAFQAPTANVTYRFLAAAAGTYDICTTVGNCAGVGGGVTTAGGTTGKIAKFTGSGSIGDSLLSESGSTVTVGGTLAVNTLTPTAALTVGAAAQDLTLQGAVVNLKSTAAGITNTLAFATPSGSNKTITVPNASGTLVVSASGPLAIDAAGNITCATCATGTTVSSLNGLTGALSIANATGSGSTVTINDASTSQKGIAQFNSTNFTVTSGTVNTIQDINTSATPSFGRLTVTSSQASNPMLLVNNTNSAGTGNLIDLQVSGASKLAVSPAGNMTLVGTLNGQTISSAASLTGTLAVAGAASLNGGATVTGTLTANTITPTGALTVGATSQSFLVQGSSASTITATSGASTTTVAFQAPTANVTYRFLTAAAGTYDICTTVGNCAGVGGGVTTAGGTTGKLAKFTGSGSIGDSLVSESGSTVTIGGTLAVNTLTPTAALTVGAAAQDLTLQGAVVNLKSTAAGVTNTLAFATPSGSNKTITVPNASGTLVVSASGPLAIDAAGNITCATCATGTTVSSLNGLTGALSIANATGSGSTVTINDASTSQKGIAQFNSTNFTASSGVINTVQDINTTATPTFGRLTVTSSQATNPMFLVNNTNSAGTGNLIDLQVSGASKLAVSPAGNMTLVGTLNGQTISSTASFTGTLAVAGAASLNGGASVTGTLTANTITPTSALTIGATSQSFLVQGSAASTITSTSGANTTTLAFQAATANVTYRFLTTAAGTYDVCTTAGNCTGVGGGVTTTGGTTGKLAKFSGSQTLVDSLVSESGSTVTIGGTLAVNTITPTAALTVGATGQDLTLQGAVVNLKSTATGITNALTFATPSGSNKTITIPNASGTLVVSASGPLAIDAAGNITCATCSTGANVSSLNGLTGALSIANATGSGSTVTINDASTSQKGIAQFNSTNFTASAGVINTIQNINSSAAPTFGQLTLTSSQASAAMLTVNNTNISATGNLIDLQLNGSSKLSVSPAGAMTIAGTINGQTISSTANFTGTLAVAGAASLNGGASVTGTLTANTITPTGALTVGATTQSFLLQGSSSSTVTATSGLNTTTLAFQTPTANVTYRLLTAAAGTYDICTTVGNCAGVGGSVTTAGGTTGKIAKFTGSNAIGDSILSESGTTVTVAGTLAANTAVQAPLFDTASAAALNIGTTNATAINLNQNTTIASGKTLTVNGTVAIQPVTDSTTTLNIKSSLNNNIFTVDTSNSRVGINLGSNNLPATTLEVAGALRLDGTTVDSFLTPAANSVPTKLNIPIYDPGSFGQVLALGVNATAQSTARAVSLFDGRTYSHQPTLGVFSPDENNLVGLSWNGTNTMAYLTTLDHASGGSSGHLMVQSGNVAGGAGSSGTVYVESGTIAGSTGYSTGDIVLQSGNAAGTSANSGSIRLDVGTATGTLGGVYIGSNNATSINLGRTSGATNATTTIKGLSVITPNTDSLTSLKVTDAAGNQLFATGGAAGVVQTELGAASTFTGRLVFDASGNGNTIAVVGQSTPAASRTITLPDETGTICLQNSANCGFVTGTSSSFIQNQNTVDQTGNFRISGTGRANTSITTPLLDSISGALNIGTTNATAINLQKSTTITGNLNQSTGTISLASNGNGSFTATGLITLTAGAASTWSTTAGNLTLQAATTNTLNLQTGGAGTVAVGDVNSTTINIGRGSNLARTINVGNTGGTLATTLNLGSTGGSSTTTVNAGTGGLSLISGANVTIGTADATGTLLVLDTKNTSGDPTGTNGGMYYNSNTGKFRCYENGAWANCVSGGTVTTLQTAYNGGNTITAADGTDLAFTFPDTTTDPSFVVNLQCATCSTNGGRFAVQSNGTDAFKVNPNGQTEIDNNSSSAFKVVSSSAGVPTLSVDTSTNRVVVGGNSSLTAELTVAPKVPSGAPTGTVALTDSPTDMAIQGRYAYVMTSTTMAIVDISRPTNPSIVSTTTIGNGGYIEVNGRYAYALTNGNLYVLDVSNPSSVSTVNTIAVSSNLYTLRLFGRYLYVGLNDGSNYGMRVYDVANAAKPTLVGSLAVPASIPVDFAMGSDGHYLYYVGDSKLTVIDVSNPASPSSVGSLATTFRAARGAAVVGKNIIIPNSNTTTLQAVNISNPASPTLTSASTPGTTAGAMAIAGRYAYLSTSSVFGSNGVMVEDISNPAAMTEVGFGTGGNYSGGGRVTALGRYLYVPGGGFGTGTVDVYDIGGTYTAGLEVGTMQAGVAFIDDRLHVGKDAQIGRNLNIGGSAQVTGNVGISGTTLIQTATDSANALQVLNSAGTATALDVDTVNSRVGIGTSAPLRTLDIAVNNSTTTAPAVRLLQSGSGDASVELNNSVNSFIFGVDTSDSSKFKISSNAANGSSTNAGYTTPLLTNLPDSGNSGLISATQITSGGTGGTLNSISVYLGTVPSGGHIKVGIYNDNGSNVPSSLVAGSSEVPAVANSWNTVPISATISASTKYWLGFRVDSNSTQYYYSTGGIASYANNAYASAWNDPFNQASTGAQPYAVYMTYTPSGSVDGFNGNLLSLTSTGALTLKNSTDSTDAFAVQNSSGLSILTADTTNNTNSANLITNSGFESSTTGWSSKGTVSYFMSNNTYHHSGHASLYTGMSGVANSGVQYNITLSNSTYYTASFYARVTAGDAPANTIVAGYSSDGTTDNAPCSQNTPTVNATSWVRFTCALVTPATHSGTPYFYIKQTDASNRDIAIDDVMLQLDSTNFADPRNGGIDFQGAVTSPLTLQAIANNSNAFNVLNSTGASIFNVDTTDTGNLVTNPSFEQSDADWASTATATATEDAAQAYVGNWSLKVVTGANANTGARYNIGSSSGGANKLAVSTTYTLSWYAKLNSGTFTDIKGRYSRNGSSYVECTPTAQTVSTTGWTRFTCTFTTDATAPTGASVVDIVQTGASAHTFWIDGVRLEQGSSARAYGNGAISLDAVVTSPFNIISNAPSTTAFTIANSTNGNLMTVDTLNNIVSFGATGTTAVNSTVAIGTSTGGNQAVSIGSSNGTSVTTIQSGSGNLTLQTNSASASIVAKSGTNGTSAFKVVNQSDTALVNVDTTNNILSFFNSATLGTWSTSSVTAPTATYRASAVTMNGYIYYLGGYNGTNAVTTTGYSKVYADGTLSSFTSTTALPATRSSGAAVAGNGYVYYIGGYDNNNPTPIVYYSKANGDGTLGTWNTTTSLPSTATDGFYRTAAVYANGYVYVLGGENSSFTSQRSVYYAKANADGTLGSWTAGTSLPTSNQRSLGTANVANGYIYYIDGADDTNIKNTVYFATINQSTGAMGSWTTATNLPTTGVRDGQSIVLNGYLYVMGGNTSINDAGSPTRTVSYTKLNPTTGQPSTWTDIANSLPTGLYGASAVTVNGYVYYMGGTTNSNTGANYTSAVSYTSSPRVQVGGSLDLVGLQGGALNDVGDGANGSMGGALTAGNTTIAGLLQVNGNANFRSGLAVLNSFTATGIINFSSSAGVSLFNIDSTGIVRIGDATNNVSFDATNHEPTLNGNARHTRRISLTPEYPNVTMTPDSGCTSCTGTMTSDNDIASPYHNYYNWNTTQATNQHYDIWVKVPIPSDFSAWTTTNPTIFLYGKTSNTTNGTLQVATYDSTGTQVQGLTSITPGSTGTWVENSVNQASGSFTYTAGGYLTLQIRMQAPQNGNTQLGEIRMDYLSKW